MTALHINIPGICLNLYVVQTAIFHLDITGIHTNTCFTTGKSCQMNIPCRHIYSKLSMIIHRRRNLDRHRITALPSALRKQMKRSCGLTFYGKLTIFVRYPRLLIAFAIIMYIGLCNIIINLDSNLPCIFFHINGTNLICGRNFFQYLCKIFLLSVRILVHSV